MLLRRSLFLLAPLLLSLLVFTTEARADSYLDCIAGAKGQKIRWNSLWSADKTDNNVDYRVTNITEFDRIPTRKVTLELVATDHAVQKTRKEAITTEDRARAFCLRIVKEERRLEFPDTTTSDVETLPFIRYTKDGWVRAPLENSSLLSLCRVGELRFSCLESDRQRYGANLRNLEEELKAQVPAQ